MADKIGRRSAKRLAVSSEGVQLQKYFFKMAHEAAARGDPVVWTSPVFPIELIWAMDIIPQSTINYSAIIGAKQMTPYYLNLTEEKGYYRDLCRYCSRNLMGFVMDRNPETAPWGGLAKPTCMVGAAFCDPVAVFWHFIAHENGVPLFYFDRSWAAKIEDMEMFPLDENGIWSYAKPRKAPHRFEWGLEQTKECVSFLETHTGRKLEKGKLSRTMELSRQTLTYATQIDRLRSRVPCPISPTDWWPNISAWLHWRGREESLAHMRKVYEEVKARADAGIGVVEKERYRLLYVGYPPWFSIGFLTFLEDEYGAVFVWEYPHPPRWTNQWDVGRPLEELTRFWLDYGGQAGQAVQCFGEMFLPAARIPGNVDGAIITRMESCKPLSSGLRYYEKTLDSLGIPWVELKMDPVDISEWDEDKVLAQISSLLEILKPRC